MPPHARPAQPGDPDPHGEPAPPPIRLTLFVSNASATTSAAIGTLRALVREHPGGIELEVVDVNEQPERAERHRVLATPTLIRELPPPVRRLVGDLSRQRQVRVALDLAALLPPGDDKEDPDPRR